MNSQYEAYWRLPIGALLERVGGNRAGLTSAAAEERLARIGPNTVADAHRRGIAAKIAKRFAEPLVARGAKALFLKGQDVEAELTEATKYWNIKPQLHSSRTGGQGWIVELDHIGRRNSSATTDGTRHDRN